MKNFYINTFLALINATLAVGDINNIIKNGPDHHTVIFLTFRLLIVIFITTLNFKILKRHQKVFNSLEVKTYDLPKHIAKLHKWEVMYMWQGLATRVAVIYTRDDEERILFQATGIDKEEALNALKWKMKIHYATKK